MNQVSSREGAVRNASANFCFPVPDSQSSKCESTLEGKGTDEDNPGSRSRLHSKSSAFNR